MDTINLEFIALKRIFQRLISGEMLSISPAREIRQLPKSEKQYHVLTADEQKKYLLASPQLLSDVTALILETRMRPTEIYKLKQKEVELEKGFLQIVGGKTKASNRKVWLSDKAANVLRARLKNIAGEYLFPKSEAEPDAPLFQINKLHLKIVKRIGFDFRLYDCRHTFATRAHDGGTDLLTLAAMLGHSSLNHVMIYAHPSETRKNEAMLSMQKKEKQKQSKTVRRRYRLHFSIHRLFGRDSLLV